MQQYRERHYDHDSNMKYDTNEEERASTLILALDCLQSVALLQNHKSDTKGEVMQGIGGLQGLAAL